MLCMLQIAALAQVRLPAFPDSLFPTYYHQRATLFEKMPATPDDIIFVGNSITDGGEWAELFDDLRVKNRGISGDVSAGVLHRLAEIAQRKPAKFFLMIGVNDLARGITADSVFRNIVLAVKYLKQESSTTKIYVLSVLPVNEIYNKFGGHTSKASQIKLLNQSLEQAAAINDYTFINLQSAFANAEGKLKPDLTNDGLHLKGEGYLLWKHEVYPYLYDLQDLPSLIPSPQNLQWKPGAFALYNCKTILVKDKALQKEAEALQAILAKKGLHLSLSSKADDQLSAIEFSLAKVDAPLNASEAYRLRIAESKISITVNTSHGAFNAVQTLAQLMRDGSMINACEILDWPAFSWRGFMVDVGRNYQSMRQLKEQIDVMAAYKLNIFHFHLTEDIAWRLQSKRYPQLTESRHMLRNPGEFYSLSEMKELIAYSKERYITLIPELDMPGHSAAFKRAMGVDMQSDEGVAICKNILTELSQELDVPYIHIGGDEVHISNKNFLPQMIAHLQSLGKKVLAWDPGGDVPQGTILQMWNGTSTLKPGYPALDSRHLYLNHFDPFDAVVSIFNHRIDDATTGDEMRLGAILCNWPDRRVTREEDLIKMNAVYPAMLTFAQRSWQGKGYENFLSDIGKPGTARFNDFVSFENALLDHKQQYFQQKPFPYFRQSDIEWKLIGPFDNKGNTGTSFLPEQKGFLDTLHTSALPVLYGATIWLRHFWSPMIGSHLQNQKENTTWYATRNIWAEESGEKYFWIGFDNFSRSTATHEPPVGAWDKRNSAAWVNGQWVAPPVFKRAGEKGDSEIPLADEGYEYRAPTKIFLQKGWNKVLIKVPVAGFKGSDWQNPVKWMFTFIEVPNG